MHPRAPLLSPPGCGLELGSPRSWPRDGAGRDFPSLPICFNMAETLGLVPHPEPPRDPSCVPGPSVVPVAPRTLQTAFQSRPMVRPLHPHTCPCSVQVRLPEASLQAGVRPPHPQPVLSPQGQQRGPGLSTGEGQSDKVSKSVLMSTIIHIF